MWENREKTRLWVMALVWGRMVGMVRGRWQSRHVPVSLAAAGADLLEEHLVEIRGLRQQLEESISTNDRLREQLECRLASTGKASGTALHVGCWAGLGGAQALHTPLHGEDTHPMHGGVLGERFSTSPPSAGLPSDIYTQGLEPGLQVTRENQALLEENRTLRLQRDHLSQGRARPPVSQL